MDYSNVHKLSTPNQMPRPLIQELDSEPEYPLAALGETLGNAATAVAEIVQCPDSIAGQSILAAAALAVQGFRNVIIDGRDYPLSLYCLTVAESGDRKTAADKLALKAHREFEEEAKKSLKREMAEYNNTMLSYEAERSRILKDKTIDIDERTEKLNSVTPPTEVRGTNIMVQEPTVEGLHTGFQYGQPSQGIFNDEGGQFLGGFGMSHDNRQKTITCLSKYWDGAPINRARVSRDDSGTLYNKRLSVHLMIQPVIANGIFDDALLNGQGFLPRFLISYSRSIAGTRLHSGLDCSKDPRMLHYWSKMKIILNTPVPILDENAKIPMLTLSPKARLYWIEIYNRIEIKLAPGGEYSRIKPTASKAAENILRVASVLALNENLNCEEIQTEHIKNSAQLMRYYLDEVKRLTEGPENKLRIERAQELLSWLQERQHPEGITPRMMYKFAPHSCKIKDNAERAQELIDILVQYGWLKQLPKGTTIEGSIPKVAYELISST